MVLLTIFTAVGLSLLLLLLLLLFLFAWTLVRGVCMNYEVVMFQTLTLTLPYLGSIINCYVRYSIILNPVRPSPPSAWFLSGGIPVPVPGYSPIYFCQASTQDHSPTWVSRVSVLVSQDPSLPAPFSDSSASLSCPPLPRFPDLQRYWYPTLVPLGKP